MAGKRARELAIDKKLVETQSHLLPRLRGSEKKRLLEQGMDPEQIEQMQDTLPTEKSKVQGLEKIRLRQRVDGGVDFAEDNGLDIDSE
jgi:large subunit ribosomal protein L24e